MQKILNFNWNIPLRIFCSECLINEDHDSTFRSIPGILHFKCLNHIELCNISCIYSIKYIIWIHLRHTSFLTGLQQKKIKFVTCISSQYISQSFTLLQSPAKGCMPNALLKFSDHRMIPQTMIKNWKVHLKSRLRVGKSAFNEKRKENFEWFCASDSDSLFDEVEIKEMINVDVEYLLSLYLIVPPEPTKCSTLLNRCESFRQCLSFNFESKSAGISNINRCHVEQLKAAMWFTSLRTQLHRRSSRRGLIENFDAKRNSRIVKLPTPS